MNAINFTDFCKDSDLSTIKSALNFYLEEFTPEKVLLYFKNWTIGYDDDQYKNGKYLYCKNITHGWVTRIDINDNAEYTFDEMYNSWQYTPKTISEFISDVLRYEDFELIFNDLAIQKIYNNEK